MWNFCDEFGGGTDYVGHLTLIGNGVCPGNSDDLSATNKLKEFELTGSDCNRNIFPVTLRVFQIVSSVEVLCFN